MWVVMVVKNCGDVVPYFGFESAAAAKKFSKRIAQYLSDVNRVFVDWAIHHEAAHYSRKSSHGCTDGNCKVCDF